MHTQNTYPTYSLETIDQSVAMGIPHRTVVLNTLIEAENQGGLTAVRCLEQALIERLRWATPEHYDCLRYWLGAVQTYLWAYSPRRYRA